MSSSAAPLANNTAVTDLTSFGPTAAVGAYEFFDSAGYRYVGLIADGGTVIAGGADQKLNTAGTMYRKVTIKGDPDLVVGNIKNTEDILGIVGTFAGASYPSCSSNSQTGCVTTSTYRSADWATVTASNIRSGTSIAGVAGTYPSSGNVLTGADATADLASSTFVAKVNSARAVEFFGSDGTGYTAARDADITATNILNSVDIFGTVGSVTPPLQTAPRMVKPPASPWRRLPLQPRRVSLQR